MTRKSVFSELLFFSSSLRILVDKFRATALYDLRKATPLLLVLTLKDARTVTERASHTYRFTHATRCKKEKRKE